MQAGQLLTLPPSMNCWAPQTMNHWPRLNNLTRPPQTMSLLKPDTLPRPRATWPDHPPPPRDHGPHDLIPPTCARARLKWSWDREYRSVYLVMLMRGISSCRWWSDNFPSGKVCAICAWPACWHPKRISGNRNKSTLRVILVVKSLVIQNLISKGWY